MMDDANRKRPAEADILALAGQLEIDGVSLDSDPLWRARLARLVAQMPDDVTTDAVARMRHALGGKMIDFDHFAAMHSLTPAENDLVRSVAKGHSVPEHARKMGISGNTARVHMQRVLSKTGARRQTDLLRKLLR